MSGFATARERAEYEEIRLRVLRTTHVWHVAGVQIGGQAVLGPQGAAVEDVTVTAGVGTLPTPSDTVAIADAAAPTVQELLVLILSEKAKNDALRARLRAHGIIAT